MSRIVTLDEFIVRRQKDFPYATGELTGLLRDIGVAAKIVNREINKAGLLSILGKAETANASGDEVQKLDLYANDRLIECLRNSGECCGIASEENDSYFPIETMEGKSAKYVVVFDPLDGSSNIDVNVSVGTIYGIYRRKSAATEVCNLQDFLQNGSELVAAGYVLYGTSTILVHSTGEGVDGFTLDPSIGEFCLSHPNMRIPDTSKFYSVNQGYYKKFEARIQHYIDDCTDKGMRLRYVGSMVSDVHRTLIKGGTFLYPGMTEHPNGKLRLLYECNPLSYLMEQAGGKALTCNFERILDVPLTELHQRATIIMGSASMVDHMQATVESYAVEEVVA